MSQIGISCNTSMRAGMITYRAGGCIIGLSLEREEPGSWPEQWVDSNGSPWPPDSFCRLWCGGMGLQSRIISIS